MASGKLAGVANPTSNTILYQSGGYYTTSSVLTIANTTGSAVTADVALRDFDQALTMDAGTYKFHEGNVFSGYAITLDQTIGRDTLTPGTALTDATAEKEFHYHDVVPAGTQTINVKAVAVTPITFEAATLNFQAGDTVTNGTASGYIYEVRNDDDTTTAGINESVMYVGDITGGTFADGDTISGSVSSASATISASGIGTATNKFAFQNPSGTDTDYQLYQVDNTLSLFTDRIYRFDLSDSSLTGLVPKFSTTVNGEWTTTPNAGVEFTTGVTSSGTVGSANAYIEINMETSGLAAASQLFMYEATTGTAANESYGSTLPNITGTGGFSVSNQFTYNAIYVYDITGGDLAINETFTAGTTTYTITAVTTGPYGYVRRWVPAGPTLHVIQGKNSAAVANGDTFLDSPNEVGGQRTMATASTAGSITDIPAGSMVMSGYSIAANSMEKVSSLVVGHGDSLVVNGGATGLNFVLSGFTDSTTDWAPVNYKFTNLAGGGAGGAAPGDAGGDAGDGGAGGTP